MSIRLAFGTAGIRAALGPGLDQLNAYTVSAVAHALCGHLLEHVEGASEKGLCIGYDARTDSELFAGAVIAVALSYGLRVRAFREPVPTPLLAYATRHQRAAAGVMITASHNPPDQNGMKIYLEGGAQVLAPHDAQIAARLAAGTFRPPPLAMSGARAPLEALGARELDAYLDDVAQLAPPPLPSGLPRFGYSALAGVGGATTRALLARLGISAFDEVEAEAEPRSDFAGLRVPNPEHAGALTRLVGLCERERLDLGFAHDPDADRLAVLVRRRDGVLRALSGDEVGALIGAFLLEDTREPARVLLVSTLVSGQLLERIAAHHGARFERTPTGFKWIAARARALERAEGLRFLFGYEEAIGYAFGSMADDKDGIAALYVLLALAAKLRAEGRTLGDELDRLSALHGLFATRQLTLPRGGGADQVDFADALRAIDPAALLGPGARRVDHAPLELLVFRGAGGDRLCVRPSGTEPKLKLYLEVGVDPSAYGSLDEARTSAERMLDALEGRIDELRAR